MIVRKLSCEDGDAFKRLRLEAVVESPTSLGRTYEEIEDMSAEDVRNQVNPSQDIAVFGAFVDGELIAIVGLRREPMEKVRHKVNVWGVYTKRVFRNQGISGRLLAAAVNEAKSNFKATILTLTVNADNVTAKALYSSFGFKVYGRHQKSLLVNGTYVHEEFMMMDLDEKADPS